METRQTKAELYDRMFHAIETKFSDSKESEFSHLSDEELDAIFLKHLHDAGIDYSLDEIDHTATMAAMEELMAEEKDFDPNRRETDMKEFLERTVILKKK